MGTNARGSGLGSQAWLMGGMLKIIMAALLVIAAAPAHAQTANVEAVPSVILWCNAYEGPDGCTYPTDWTACQAQAASYNSQFAQTNIYHTHIEPVSANGVGYCTVNWVNDLWTVPNAIINIRGIWSCPVPTVNPSVPYRLTGTLGTPTACTRPAQQTQSCPINMTGTPPACTCKPGFSPAPNGAGCVAETLSITIEDINSAKQPFTIEPSTLYALKAVVTNQDGKPPQTPANIALSIKVAPTSGGHLHGDTNRPKGELISNLLNSTTTGPDGTYWFVFYAPQASGIHTITATCDRCSTPANATVNVKVKEVLVSMPASSLYTLIGAVPGRHTDNHYMTAEAFVSIANIAQTYQQQFARTQPLPLHVNDASLEWGGVFDIDKNNNWTAPHAGHRRGKVVDVRANQDEGAILFENFTLFQKLAKDKRAKAQVHCSKGRESPACLGKDGSQDPFRHFHILLLGVDQ